MAVSPPSGQQIIVEGSICDHTNHKEVQEVQEEGNPWIGTGCDGQTVLRLLLFLMYLLVVSMKALNRTGLGWRNGSLVPPAPPVPPCGPYVTAPESVSPPRDLVPFT